MNIYLKEAKKIQKKINCKLQPENMDDGQYWEYWYVLNVDFKYFLMYLKKYLSRYIGCEETEYGFKTDNYLILLNLVEEALKIGNETTYYNNKISRKLKDLDLTYFNFNRQNFKKILEEIE